MDAARTIREARVRAGLSKRELARRAGTSAAALVAYESGRRHPTTGTFDRILRAAGFRVAIVLEPLPVRPDPRRAATALAQVLDLADHLPHRRPPEELAFPRFPS